MGKHIEREKKVVAKMIGIYCHDHHRKGDICDDCRTLQEYAFARLDRCRFGEEKTTCRKCPIHCYKPDMKQAMRDVMRYAGTRMIWHAPIDAIRHIISEAIK